MAGAEFRRTHFRNRPLLQHVLDALVALDGDGGPQQCRAVGLKTPAKPPPLPFRNRLTTLAGENATALFRESRGGWPQRLSVRRCFLVWLRGFRGRPLVGRAHTYTYFRNGCQHPTSPLEVRGLAVGPSTARGCVNFAARASKKTRLPAIPRGSKICSAEVRAMCRVSMPRAPCGSSSTPMQAALNLLERSVHLTESVGGGSLNCGLVFGSIADTLDLSESVG